MNTDETKVLNGTSRAHGCFSDSRAFTRYYRAICKEIYLVSAQPVSRSKLNQAKTSVVCGHATSCDADLPHPAESLGAYCF
jgi:hypothetical protein